MRLPDRAAVTISPENRAGSSSRCLGKRVREDRDRNRDRDRERFNVPFDLECKGCRSTIAKGVQVNAVKHSVGVEHTRKIRNCTINCAYCGHTIVLESVPSSLKYKIIKGAHKSRDEPRMGVSQPDFEALRKELRAEFADDIARKNSGFQSWVNVMTREEAKECRKQLEEWRRSIRPRLFRNLPVDSVSR